MMNNMYHDQDNDNNDYYDFMDQNEFEKPLSWKSDDPLMMSHENNINNFDVFGPRCKDNKCTNCGYKTKGKEKSSSDDYDIYDNDTDDENDNNINADSNIDSDHTAQESDKIENFEAYIVGGGACHCLGFILALAIMIWRKDHLRYGPIGLMSLVLFICICPWCYIIFALLSTTLEQMSGSNTDFIL